MAALNFPETPSNNEKFEGTNGADYTYDSTDNSWTGELAITTDINPSPSDITASPDFVSGTGTQLDPYVITPQTVALNGSVTSDQYITIANQTEGLVVKFSNSTTPSGIAPKFNQPMHSINPGGSWEGYLVYSDAEGMTTTTDGTNVGNFSIGSVYFTWTITQTA